MLIRGVAASSRYATANEFLIAKLLGADDPVSKHLPGLKELKVYTEDGGRGPRREMTVRDPMRHTYGFFGDSPVDRQYLMANVLDRNSDLGVMVGKLAGLPLRYEPGQDWRYSVSVDVLGRVIEVISKKPLDEFFQERIFEPLDMHDTGFFVPAEVPCIRFDDHTRDGVGFGLGFSVRVKMTDWDPQGRGGEYGWGGAASTHCWGSPNDDLIVITLEQVMPYSVFTEFAIKGLIYDAIED